MTSPCGRSQELLDNTVLNEVLSNLIQSATNQALTLDPITDASLLARAQGKVEALKSVHRELTSRAKGKANSKAATRAKP